MAGGGGSFPGALGQLRVRSTGERKARGGAIAQSPLGGRSTRRERHLQVSGAVRSSGRGLRVGGGAHKAGRGSRVTGALHVPAGRVESPRARCE